MGTLKPNRQSATAAGFATDSLPIKIQCALKNHAEMRTGPWKNTTRMRRSRGGRLKKCGMRNRGREADRKAGAVFGLKEKGWLFNASKRRYRSSVEGVLPRCSVCLKPRRFWRRAPEARQKIAHGASRGNNGPKNISPVGAAENAH